MLALLRQVFRCSIMCRESFRDNEESTRCYSRRANVRGMGVLLSLFLSLIMAFFMC